MKNTNLIAACIGTLGGAIGKGIIAGVAGTVAITLSQKIEMEITKRKPSTTPADAASKVLHIRASKAEYKEQFSSAVHWGYGISWGVARGLLSLMGLSRCSGTAVHFSAVYGTALLMLPGLKVAPPVKEWGTEAIATDGVHHAVYALVTGLVYDAIQDDDEQDGQTHFRMEKK